jgi:hypothetical protein
MKANSCSPTWVLPALVVLVLGCGPDSGRSLVSPELDALGTSGQSASGHGNWFNAAGEYVSRSFHAITKEDGLVRGNFVQHVTAVTGEKRVNKGDINCLLIGPNAAGLGPNEAVLSGTVEENVTPSLIGQTQIFRIQDNGEGSKDLPDQMSPLFFRTPESGIDCRSFLPPIVTPIESGNLQVKP